MGTPAPPPGDSGWRRGLDALRPTHQHSPFSATLLLMSAVLLSRVIGYVREAYIAYAFGAGAETDAYVAAFTIPDWLNYLVAGGTASITFVSIFTRYVSQGREAEAHKAFHIIITVMTTVLVAGVGVAMVFTPQIERVIFPGFSPEQLELCVRLTRILLPAQLFFYVGGVVSAVLLARRMFLFPALAPLLYNVFIIVGGVALAPQMGIASLAVGAVAGGFAGPFLINAIGAARVGVRYRPSFDTSHPAFREWVHLSIPLMLGVSLVAADEWILRYFASGHEGGIAWLNYAKRLFAVPLAVLAQATGQASLPFFARLYGEGKKDEFSATVNASVYRVVAVSMLAAAWMAAAALPAVDLVYRRGAFTPADATATAAFFFWFALALPFWSAQALYARAFYAAGNTLTPMVAGTIVTAASLPVYYWLFHSPLGLVGLAVASGIGIIAHTVTLAVMLESRVLVKTGALPWKGLGKAAFAAALAAAAAYAVRDVLGGEGRWREVVRLALITVTWGAGAVVGLLLTRSELPSLLRRRGAAPSVAVAPPRAEP